MKLIFSTLSAFVIFCLVSSPVPFVSGQASQPDFINVEYQTVPNILFLEITSLEAIATGVRGTVVISNPMLSLYLGISLSGDYVSLDPTTDTTRLWSSIGLVPPGQSLEYIVEFDSTDNYLQVQSPLLHLRALSFNAVEIIGNHFVPGVNSAQLIPVFARVFIQFENALAELASNLDCLDTPTIEQLPDCLSAIREIFGSEVFKQMVGLILRDLGVEVSQTTIGQFVALAEFIDAWSNVADGLVYIGLVMNSGQPTNSYLLRPMTLDPTLLPPWPPRLVSPLAPVSDNSPTFMWSSVPDINVYEFQLDSSTGFFAPMVNVTVSETSFDLPFELQLETPYFWRVRGVGQVGPGPWSTGAVMVARAQDPQQDLLQSNIISESSIARVTQLRQIQLADLPSETDAQVLAWSPDSQRLAVAGSAYTRLFDVNSLEVAPILFDSGNSVSFSPNGDALLIGQRRNALSIIDIEENRLLSAITPLPPEPVNYSNFERFATICEISIADDGRTVALAYCGIGLSAVVDVSTGSTIAFFLESGNHVAFAPSEYRLAVGWENPGHISIGDLVEVRTPQFTIEVPTGWVSDLEFSHDGAFLASANGDATARIWDPRNGQQLMELPTLGAVVSVSFSPDSSLLIGGTTGEAMYVWDMRYGSELRKIDEAGSVVVFSPNGNQIAAINRRSMTLTVWGIAPSE
ncbi:MAG: hypothetical protein L6Q98_22785 [Anaerolineae bacterium]|nr:hypothetical protein [Anaerolineae bacterium]NUQ05198.1 hypothetical protein [Anaerolineae bacterium]